MVINNAKVPAKINENPFSDEHVERFHDLYEIKTYIVKNLMSLG